MAKTRDHTMFTQKDYKVRPGTTNLGREYEYKMMALLSLRCVICCDDMWMASNAKGAGAFDDIVIRIRHTKGRTLTYLVQLKHKESSKPITEKNFLSQKGDFSLLKYSSDIAAIKEGIEAKSEGIIGDLGELQDLYFVIFTNSTVSKYQYLEKGYSRELSFLNTGKGSAGAYKFNTAKLPPLVDDVCVDHCVDINLFTNQISAEHLDRYIEAELEKVIGHLQLLPINAKSMTDEFIKYVTDWAKGNLGGNYYLTKGDVVAKLSDLLLARHELDLRLEPFNFYTHDQKLIWNRVVYNKVVTIVDYDDKVLHFLKQYIGSEVHQYCKDHDETWGHKLSDEAQTFLYQNCNNLKKTLLRRIGNYGKATPYDIYKCLWLNGELPMLLQINHTADYENIKKIIKLSNKPNLKIIVVNENRHALVPLKTSLGYFVTMSDLNDEEGLEILKLSVKIQGRSSIALESVLDESMYTHIKCKDIIHILLTDYSIGTEYEPLPMYYVQRSLFKILFKFEVLTLEDEIFAITDNTNIFPNMLLDFDTTNIFITKNAAEVEALKSNKKPVHHLRFDGDDYLEWRGSFGSTKNILQYRVEDIPYDEVESVFENDCGYDIPNTRIISECPGMGKSTMMNFISIYAPVDTWVLNVALSEHDDYYERVKHDNYLKACDHLKYFNEAILKKHRCSNVSLAREVFRKLLEEKKVLILLDGFDEVCFLHKDEATTIAKCLTNAGYRMWLTTRPHMKLHLEDQLHTVATTLRPFTRDDQVKFLTKYFVEVSKAVNPDLNNRLLLINQFVYHLLVAAMINLSDTDSKFTGIPLQTKLLADVFTGELKSSLQDGIVKLNDQFNLVYLYEKFVKSKTDILCEKFGKDARHTRALLRNHQQLVALKFMFDEDQLLHMDIDKKICEFYESEAAKRQFLQRDGLIVIEVDNHNYNIRFVHRTFAEYLSAQWLSENYSNTDPKIRKTVKDLIYNRFTLWKSNYSFLFRMVDCILARNCPLHISVINEQAARAESLIQSDPDIVDLIDDGGRTVLHIAALYAADQYFFEIRCFKQYDSLEDDMVHLIEQIPHNKMLTIIKPDALGYNPLDNAIANRSFTIANKICELSERIALNVYSGHRFNLLVYMENSFKCMYIHLFAAILEYFVCHDILFHGTDIQEDTTIELYCKEAFVFSQLEVDKYVKETGVTTISNLLERINIKSPNESYYHDLRFAIAFGKENNVRKLFAEGADLSELDMYHNNPLHYAAINKQDSIVEMLMSNGVEVNKPGWKGNTALHFSCKSGYRSIVRKLLAKGADLEVQNDEGDTPLLVALWHEHVGTAKLLISRNASMGVENKFGSSCIHYAAKAGNKSLVQNLVDKVDINKQNKKGDLPLFFALKGEHFGVARILLNNGSNVNIENSKNKTCLHFAAKAGAKAIVHDFISKGLDVNKQDSKGDTPLILAIENNHINVANLLLLCGADANLRNKAGNTALHYATTQGRYEILNKLVSASTDINLRNESNETPLLRAVSHRIFYDNADVERQIKTLECLLNNGASINSQDDQGRSSLHHISSNCRTSWRGSWWDGDDEVLLKYFAESAMALLLNAGADISLKNDEGKTALDVALDEQNTKVSSLIYQNILNRQYCTDESESTLCTLF